MSRPRRAPGTGRPPRTRPGRAWADRRSAVSARAARRVVAGVDARRGGSWPGGGAAAPDGGSAPGGGARFGRGRPRRGSTGSASWTARSSVRLPSVSPISVMPRRRMSGSAAASSSRATTRSASVRAVASGSVCDRVARSKSSNRSRSVTVRQTRRAPRSRRASLSTRPISITSSSAGVRAPRPSARWAPIERRRRRVSTRRGSRLCESACSWRPEARPTTRTSVASASWATSPTVRIPRAWSFAAVFGPTPHSRSTGSGWRNVELAVRRHHEQPVGLRHAARHLGQELRPRDPDRDRQPDLVEHARAQPHGDLLRRPRDPPQPADVEERLVDRQALDQRRRVAEDLEHRLARLGVGGHARRDDDRVGAEPPPLAAAHRRLDAARLRLVARGEHHPAAHDDRLAAQPRVVALLDRRVERVQIGVEDLGDRHEHMFASAPDGEGATRPAGARAPRR